MKIGLTGGAGFIASHLFDVLNLRGDEVLVADNFSRGLRQNLPRGAEIVACDLADPAGISNWQRHLHAFGADVLVHAASQMSHYPIDHLAGMRMAVGYLETIKVLQVPTVFISSSSAHNAPTRGGLGEPVVPEGLYGMCKLFVEWGLDELAREGRVPSYLAIRPSNAYGPREVFSGHPHIHVIPTLIRKMLLEEGAVHVLGDGTQTRPFTYVMDIVSAITAAIDVVVKESVRRIVLVHGPGVAIGDLTAMLVERIGPRPISFDKERAIGVSSRELPQPDEDGLLGWVPQYDIAEGLDETIAWVRAHPECLRRGEVDDRAIGPNVA